MISFSAIALTALKSPITYVALLAVGTVAFMTLQTRKIDDLERELSAARAETMSLRLTVGSYERALSDWQDQAQRQYDALREASERRERAIERIGRVADPEPVQPGEPLPADEYTETVLNLFDVLIPEQKD